MNTRKFKLNADLKTFKAGQIISLECDEQGVPIDNFWYRRYQDSFIDKCIELVPEKSQAKGKKDESV